MKPPTPTDRAIELTVGATTLIATTLAFLLDAAALGAIALVTGGIAYGIVIARRPHE